jgi:hypothetical protein
MLDLGLGVMVFNATFNTISVTLEITEPYNVFNIAWYNIYILANTEGAINKNHSSETGNPVLKRWLSVSCAWPILYTIRSYN